MSQLLKNKKVGFRKKSFSQWLGSFSARNKLIIVIVLIVFILGLEFGNFYLGVKIMSGIRSWVAAEDYWSHQQKTAHYLLQEYVISRDEDEYDQISSYLNAYYGDRNAKLEMEKSTGVNYQYARAQFIYGGVNPGDANDTVFLFRYFRYTPWVSQAIVYWDRGDKDMEAFISISQQIHNLIITPLDKSNPNAQAQQSIKIDNLIKQENIEDNDNTSVENGFAVVLGQGSRAIKVILLIEAAVFDILLGALAISISVFIAKITIQVEKDKNDFMRIANHQLNTPLSIMKNAHEMVKDKSLTLKKGFEYSDIGLSRAINVFEDIKTVLELEGKTKYDIKPHNLEIAMEAAVAYAKKTIATNKKNIDIIIEKPSFLIPMVMCDLKQLNNAIYNLLDNAVYYTLKGTITINYDLLDKKYVKVAIKDTGIGFEAEDKDKFGQKFYRSKKALLAHPDGSGLGLYIVKNIIESNKGQLFFDSDGYDKGSMFGFILPITKR